MCDRSGVFERIDCWTGLVTLYSGLPKYDQFGDADKKLLQSRTLPVTFRKSNPDQKLSASANTQGRSYALYEPDGDTLLNGMRLVLNSEQPGDCRLLITNADNRILRVLPLQSVQLQRQAKQYPVSINSHLNLHSDLFIGSKNRFRTIQIAPMANQLSLSLDDNSFELDAFGNVGMSTLMAPSIYKLNLVDLELSDPSGQGRRVYRCDLQHDNTSDESMPVSKTQIEDVNFLMLNPVVGGWHRLILMKEGKVERILSCWDAADQRFPHAAAIELMEEPKC